MKSLRLRLALITTAISGVVLVVFGLLGWGLTFRLLRESIDLRISVPLDRTVQLLHPRADFEAVFEGVDQAFLAEVDEGKRLILALDRDGDELHRTPRTQWAEQLDPRLLDNSSPVVPFPDGVARPNNPPPRPAETGSEDDWQPEDFFLPREGGEGGRPPRRGDFGPLNGGPPPHLLRPPRGEREQGRRDRAPPRIAFRTVSINGANWRIGIVEDRGYRLILGSELSQFEGEIRRVRNLFLTALPLCLFIIGLGGWFVARRALKPVDLIADTAGQVTVRGLDLRIPEQAHEYRELSHLVDVLNGMMARLEQSFQHANRFSADVSHELKTPLAVMQAAVQTALKECAPGSSEEQHLLTVSQEAERLKRITRSLMLLAQADSGRLVLRKEKVSVSEEAEALCEDAEILCEKNGLRLTKEIQPDLFLETDSVLLRQAMQNLVSNAVKYNQPEGEVVCRLFRRSGQDETVFSVANTGPGIPEEDRDKIFQRFYRVDRSRSRDIDGFGLGLNLASEIVRAMGGELRLVDASEEITRFEIAWSAIPRETETQQGQVGDQTLSGR